jgi:hypothetical protein
LYKFFGQASPPQHDHVGQQASVTEQLLTGQLQLWQPIFGFVFFCHSTHAAQRAATV